MKVQCRDILAMVVAGLAAALIVVILGSFILRYTGADEVSETVIMIDSPMEEKKLTLFGVKEKIIESRFHFGLCIKTE